MYAIIKTGGKQYRVEEGDIIEVELLKQETGANVEFGEVLFVNDGKVEMVGSPYVEGFTVLGKVLTDEVKGPKIFSYKFKRRKNYHKKQGHRQCYTRVEITSIKKATKAPKAAKVAKAATATKEN